MSIVDEVKNSELFSSLDPDQLDKIVTMCRGSSFKEGSRIFTEGSEATELYILTEGSVALEMELKPLPDRPAIPTAVEVVRRGGILGLSAVVEPHVYSLSARCMSNCTALAIKGDLLRKRLADDPRLGYEVMKQLSRLIMVRLAETRLRLTSGIGLIMLGKDLRGLE